MKMSNYYRNYVQVDLEKIRKNCITVHGLLGDSCRLMTVLKANAYGYGIRECALCCENETDLFAVATLEEALEMRSAGVEKPILIFGPVDVEEMDAVCQEDLILTLSSLEYATAVQVHCRQIGRQVRCHIKVDTGLNRMGIRCHMHEMSRSIDEARAIFAMPELLIEGTYTHFACASSPDPDDQAFTQGQFDIFMAFCNKLEDQGLKPGLRHCCSATGILSHPEMHLDMVRTGMLVLGQSISNESKNSLGLETALTWRARVLQVRDIAANESIGYNRMYRTDHPIKVAVLAAGYADGYKQNYSNKTRILLHGQYAPVLGSICMDYLMVDVSEIEGVRTGDYAVLIGVDGENEITPMELGQLNGTASGDVTCAISARVPRVYYPAVHSPAIRTRTKL